MGIFFSKNKNTAIRRVSELVKKGDLTASQRMKFKSGKRPMLAKKQIKHIAGFKTFKF